MNHPYLQADGTIEVPIQVLLANRSQLIRFLHVRFRKEMERNNELELHDEIRVVHTIHEGFVPTRLPTSLEFLASVVTYCKASRSNKLLLESYDHPQTPLEETAARPVRALVSMVLRKEFDFPISSFSPLLISVIPFSDRVKFIFWNLHSTNDQKTFLTRYADIYNMSWYLFTSEYDRFNYTQWRPT